MSEREVAVDFEAAQTFLDQARAAFARGDMATFTAAAKLITIALDVKAPRFSTEHLKA